MYTYCVIAALILPAFFALLVKLVHAQQSGSKAPRPPSTIARSEGLYTAFFCLFIICGLLLFIVVFFGPYSRL